MARRPLRSLLLGRLARWLERWSGSLNRQAELWAAAAQRSREAAGEPTVQVVPDEDKRPGPQGSPPEGPPAHWLARLRQSGHPLPWMEHRGGPTPYRPAVRQPPGGPVRGPGASQPAPSQVEPSDVGRLRARPRTAQAAEDLAAPGEAPPEAGSTQDPDRTRVGEVAKRRSEWRTRPTHEAERPARLLPRPRFAQKAETGAPVEEAGQPQAPLPSRSRARPGFEPPGEAEAPEAAPGLQENRPLRRGPERPAVTTAARSEHQHEEAQAVQQPALPRWSPLQEPHPRSTASVPRTRPVREEGQEADTQPLGPQTIEGQEVSAGMLESVEGPGQSLWPSLDEDRPGHRVPPRWAATLGEAGPDRGAPVGVGGAGFELDVARAVESARLTGPSGSQATHEQATRRRLQEQDQLWEETPPGDRWPSLPEWRYPDEAAPEALTEEAWNAQLSAWQRLRRLDEEQRGNLWSASPF
jgi:hypothetical protein